MYTKNQIFKLLFLDWHVRERSLHQHGRLVQVRVQRRLRALRLRPVLRRCGRVSGESKGLPQGKVQEHEGSLRLRV